jgi:hypothetical protein
MKNPLMEIRFRATMLIDHMRLLKWPLLIKLIVLVCKHASWAMVLLWEAIFSHLLVTAMQVLVRWALVAKVISRKPWLEHRPSLFIILVKLVMGRFATRCLNLRVNYSGGLAAKP